MRNIHISQTFFNSSIILINRDLILAELYYAAVLIAKSCVQITCTRSQAMVLTNLINSSCQSNIRSVLFMGLFTCTKQVRDS